jgi:hypothetical protein
MKKIDPVVLKETKYIFIWVLLLSALMQSVFLIIGKWDYTVLLGNLLSGSAAVLNFLLMGISIANALEKEAEDAKKAMKLSQSYRFLFLIAVAALGVALPAFHSVAVILPLFFPRIAVGIRPMAVDD